jgi:hypothetical protein
MRAAVGLLLVAEALSTALRTAGRLSILSVYPWMAISFVAARFAVALVQFAGGTMLLNGRPGGRAIGQWAFGTSAVLRVFELGFGFAPTSLFPSYRWPAVGLYCAYAAAAIGYLRHTRGQR